MSDAIIPLQNRNNYQLVETPFRVINRKQFRIFQLTQTGQLRKTDQILSSRSKDKAFKLIDMTILYENIDERI